MASEADGSTGLRMKAHFSDFEWDQLQMQGLIQQRAKSLTGQKLEMPSEMTKENLILLLKDRKPVDEGSSFSNSKYNLTEYHIDPYPPSSKPVKELEKITFKDLRIETRHLGNKIFVKTVSPARRIASVSVIVEDEKGVPGQLQIFNLGRKFDLEEFLPVGQIVCVKEPLFKISTTAIQSLRVDHAGDLVLVDDDDDETPEAWRVEDIKVSAANCKEIGNQAVRDGKLVEGIRWYTKGLGILASNPENLDESLRLALLLNRALSHLQRGEYEHSLRDSESALLIDHVNQKALYRKAKSLYQLRRYGKCGNTLTKLIVHHPNNQEAKNELAIVRQRLLEETRGAYDFAKMVEMAKSDFIGQEYDFADYSIPVYPKASRISGNGLFTRRDVKMGDLLYVGKAFMNCRGSDNGVSVMIRPVDLHVDQGVGAFLTSAVLEKLNRVPGAYKEILKLHNAFGEEWTDGRDGDGPIDSFLVRNICNSNAFSSCSYYDQFPEMHPEDDGTPSRRNPKKTQDEPWDPNSGLWILPAYTNHSCISNAYRTFLGDMMILRAVVDIPKETEVLISYTDHNLPYEERQGILQTSWKFTCQCQLCVYQSAPGVSEALESVMIKMHELITRVGDTTPKFEDAEKLKHFIIQLEKLYIYDAHIVPRPYLGEHILRLYGFLNEMGLAQAAYNALHAGPPAWGAIYHAISEKGVEFQHKGWADGDLVRAYVRLATVTGPLGGKIFEDWREAARDCYRVVVGEDVTFEETFGEAMMRYTKDGGGYGDLAALN
ncbi:hypothetical protein TWF569_007376 [Orbilia oligospora]|uniref:SET domain-containing protein n=1 Tax=Orbilia oligospora TaxID=2813651 RepID=A0A7C8NQL3_ORBOL|nr:hypothetical protein TWF703_005792 [Orbilia oligospora]KAF3143287.1 hypothetical protein TWF569_007376 [Orbilia oligospora]